MRVVVELVGGVRLRQLLHVEAVGEFISLFPVDTIEDVDVACAAVALRDAGVQSGMQLTLLQVVPEPGVAVAIEVDEDGVQGNYRHVRLLQFEELSLIHI